MRRPAGGLPERLRAALATNLERRLLKAAAQEQPSLELRRRMAQGLGVAVPLLSAPPGGAALGAAGAAPKALTGWSWKALLPWASGGVTLVAVAAAIVAPRVSTSPAPNVRPSAQAVSAPWPLASVPSASAKAPSAPAPSALSEAPHATAVESSAIVAAPSPTPRSQRSREGTTASNLQDQIALLDAARSAMSVGASGRALENLRLYQDKYPAGSFRPEAAALTIEALAKLGRTAEARALAEWFLAEHAGSPLADRIARIVGPARQ